MKTIFPNIFCYAKKRGFSISLLLLFGLTFSFLYFTTSGARFDKNNYTTGGIEATGYAGENGEQQPFLQLPDTLPEKKANPGKFVFYKGAIIRGDQDKKEIALIFTGDEFADGGNLIAGVLKKQAVKASFFFTGNFYRTPDFEPLINKLQLQGNYLGPHSDQHLLYCDWNNRDSLLVSQSQFTNDLINNLEAIKSKTIQAASVRYFLPSYEWYNDSIAAWTKAMGIQLVNYSPGTLSAADYTYPALKNYRNTAEIFQSIINKEKEDEHGLNGFMLLLHIGTDPKRTDKFYHRLDELITVLKQKGYHFKTVNELLQ